jgi:trehalose utilization protein
MTIRVAIWNEFIHERENATVRAIYPDGIHATIAAGLGSEGMSISTEVTLVCVRISSVDGSGFPQVASSRKRVNLR